MTSPVSTQLKGNLGPIGIALMVVATAAPLTVLVGVSPLIIGLGNGIAAPMDALYVGVVMLLFSIGFVSMSKYIENAGAFYAYILKGMGRVVGLGAASLAVMSYTLILIALEAYIGVALSDALSGLLGISLPWWLYTIGIVAFVGFLGYRNVELSAKVLGVALILEIGVILILNLSVIGTVGVAGMDTTPFEISAFLSGSPGLGILFAIFGFIGFESTVVYREEAHNPERSIPLATYIAVIFITLLYFISLWCVVVGVGMDDVVRISTENAGSMYLDLLTRYLGHVMHDLAQVLLITSLFAVVISIHNIVARYKYVLGSCGVLMAQLAKVHATHASPYIASAVQTFVSVSLLLAAAIMGFDPVTEIYAWGAAAGTLGYMIIVALACFSIICFFARRPEPSSTWATKISPALSFIGLIGFLYIAFSNLSALTGSVGYNKVNVTIVVILIVAFVVGSGGAVIMRLKAPRRFAAILNHMN
ncbi:APC family permease [Pseudomonas aeruginosa]|uniref:APC family permease n=1 Tax=Pseudomonas aeruginosa TaxID=287 RepID=UPI00093D8375|nr:APC family permease [Pseudomonas aeruginosa]MCS7830937.1 APC family permease [Pseudomonas aeruginosa]HBO1343806.1 APC family permease [Pseudomonas aeruginosa]HBO1588896.1 APC family permease [Pseudomonas aeruginosa]HBO1968559.1 APC family permease [Pseudomonas aeruginosa]HBO2065898.1 APC family permease [Pseudomonas aeruginosa]